MTELAARTDVPLLRPISTNPMRVYWQYAINVAIMHLLALLAFVPWFFSWSGVVACVLGLYVFGTLGINLGYHRMLTHRSFTLPRWLEYCVTTLSVQASTRSSRESRGRAAQAAGVSWWAGSAQVSE